MDKKNQKLVLDPVPWDVKTLDLALDPNTAIVLGAEAKKRIRTCRAWLENKTRSSADTIYGVNTGFGSLCRVRIPEKDLEQLQLNLIRSHAAGVGPDIAPELARLLMLLKARSLAFGHSGVRLELVESMLALLNARICPAIPSKGSLGASGDLAPLAHLGLLLIGEGMAYHKDLKITAADALKLAGLKPLKLASKEGLALINGTQFMLAYGLHIQRLGGRLLDWAGAISALSLEAFNGREEPFHPLLHGVRAHQGQIKVAKQIKEWRKGSPVLTEPKHQVQDPYSFRCIPQVHGASWDALDHAGRVLMTEANSVTDNPIIFPEDDLILSGGNFHGQPLALALDHMGLALHELGNISERRTFLLLSGQRGLPEYLSSNPGLESGLMIAQYTAASLVSLNKQLCTPSSADSITSSNGQEDHVSMGANAALKSWDILHNTAMVLGVELLCAVQALDLKQTRTSARLKNISERVREFFPDLRQDRTLSTFIQSAASLLLKEDADQF